MVAWWLAIAMMPLATAEVQPRIGGDPQRSEASESRTRRSASSEVYQAVKRLLDSDRFDEARSMLSGLPDNQKDAVDVEVQIASLLYEIGKPTEGLLILDASDIHDRNPFETHLAYARIAAIERRWADADAHLRLVLGSPTPSDWSTTFTQQQRAEVVGLIAEVASSRGDWERAEQHWSRLLKVRPADQAAKLKHAHAVFQLGRHGEAYRLLQEWASIGGSEDGRCAELQMGKLFESSADYESAETWYRKALQENVTVGVRCQLARLLVDRNRPAEAIMALELELLSANETQISRLDWKGRTDCCVLIAGLAWRMMGRYDDSESALVEMQTRRPSSMLVAHHLALVWIESDDPETRRRGLQLATRTVETAPDASSLTAFGWVTAKLGDLATAENILTQAMASGPEVPRDAALYLADVKRRLGKDEEAKTLETFSQRADGPIFFHR